MHAITCKNSQLISLTLKMKLKSARRGEKQNCCHSVANIVNYDFCSEFKNIQYKYHMQTYTVTEMDASCGKLE